MKQKSWRWRVFRLGNPAHNTLTVGSMQHCVGGRATIFNVVDTDAARGGVIDLSEVFQGQLSSARRKILLLDNDSLLVADAIRALPEAPADIQWRMVTDASPQITEEGILLEQGGYRMLLSASSDDSSLTPEYKIWPAAGTEEWDVPNPGKSIVGYSIRIPAGRECTISLSLREQNP